MVPWQSDAGVPIAHVPEIEKLLSVPARLWYSVPVKVPETKVTCIRMLSNPLGDEPWDSIPHTPGAVVRVVAVQAAKLVVAAPITAINSNSTNKLVFFIKSSGFGIGTLWVFARTARRANVHRLALPREQKKEVATSRAYF